MKRLYATLKLFLGCSIGIFLGRCIYLYFDFKARPDLYAMQSALVCGFRNSGDHYGGSGCRTAGGYVAGQEKDQQKGVRGSCVPCFGK